MGDSRLGRPKGHDLSTGKHPHQSANGFPAQFDGADRHRADLPGAEKAGGVARNLSWEDLPTRSSSRPSRAWYYFTIHAACRCPYIPLHGRACHGIVSRGGSIMAKWCLRITRESFLYAAFFEEDL